MARRPRICLLAPFPYHALPGQPVTAPAHHATWLPPLARALEGQDDFDLHWITCGKEVARHQTLRAWNQTFHRLPRKRLSWEILSGFRHERRLIQDLLRDLSPDLVHAWGTEEGYGLAAGTWPGKRVLSVQGILQAYCAAAPQHPLLRWQARQERRVLAAFRHLTVESEWGRDKLAHLAPHADVRVIEYGVDLPGEPPRRQVAEGPVALFVGTLSKLKGVDLLLDAFADERLRSVRLVLLGGGPLRRPDRRPQRNVEFLGHQMKSEVEAWMGRASFLIHPTRADTSPNCVKEARVIGMPVITTPEGGQTAYVEDGVSGAIFRSGDREGLIAAVLGITSRIATDPAFGIAGRDLCRAQLDPRLTASSFLRLYRELLDPPEYPARLSAAETPR
jgi:glycosyltransferase involved in cell wall biosynthesis